MIQLSTGLSTALTQCSKHSIAILLSILNEIDTHGNANQLDFVFEGHWLRYVLGIGYNDHVHYDYVIRQMGADNLVKIDDDNFCVLWKKIEIRKNPANNRKYLRVIVNDLLVPYIMELDYVGYSKIELCDCTKLLYDCSQGKRSLLMYLYLVRKKYLGEIEININDIKKLLGLKYNVDMRNATRRIINPVFENVGYVMSIQWFARTYQNKIVSYHVRFV